MCGIVGLFCKSPELEPELGRHLAAMLEQMGDRGPDSAGVAVYRHPAAAGWSKLTLYSAAAGEDWNALSGDLAEAFGGVEHTSTRAKHAVVHVEASADEAESWLRRNRPESSPKPSIRASVPSSESSRALTSFSHARLPA